MSLMTVQNVSKAYTTYASEWQRVGRLFGLPVKPREKKWVLRHISFSVQPGEAIGIVGQNGAGKSTLLKLITGTARPSEGHIHVNGRISALLELGMGFNPELTGRQNVIHSAGLMGFSHDQILESMPQIEAFAEIGDAFDKPVRTYSSGMQMRVAFAVATFHRPQILIVDEALSVGDAYFQHKSFNRIREFQAKGTTLLIVSHDRGAIQALCNRALLLERGSIIREGDPEEIMDFYNALIAERENSTVKVMRTEEGKAQICSGTGEAIVKEIGLYNASGEAVEYVGVGDPLELRVKAHVNCDIKSLVFGYSIKDRLGQIMYGTNTWHTKQVIWNPSAGDEYNFSIRFPANYGVGTYSIQTALVDRDTHLTANYEWEDRALMFNVVNTNHTFFIGCLWDEPVIQIEQI